MAGFGGAGVEGDALPVGEDGDLVGARVGAGEGEGEVEEESLGEMGEIHLRWCLYGIGGDEDAVMEMVELLLGKGIGPAGWGSGDKRSERTIKPLGKAGRLMPNPSCDCD